MAAKTLGVGLGLWLLLCSVALAQDDATKAQARENFNRGLGQYEAGEYDGALESFQEAYRLSPHPMVRVNMANCYDRLGKPIEALFHFERFIVETDGDTSRAEQRREVQSAITRLRRSTTEVILRVIPDGATVRIDDGDTRRSPILESVRMAAGDHVVEVSLTGYEPVTRRLALRGGTSESVDIRLERVSAVAVAPAPVVAPAVEPTPAPSQAPVLSIAPLDESEESEPAPVVEAEPNAPPPNAFPTESPARPASSSVFTTPVIIALAVGGACLGIGTLFGLAAMKANNDFESYRAQSLNPAQNDMQQEAARQKAFDAADKADAAATLADLMFGAALIAGGTGLVLILTHDDGEAPSPSARLQVGPGSLTLSGQF